MDDKKLNNNDMRNNRIRSAIYPMAGLYLLFLAYDTYRNISVTSGNDQIMMIVFCILFTICGLGLNILGLSMVYKFSKKSKDKEDQKTE